MSFRNWLGSRLPAFWNRRDREKEFNRELESHLEMETQELPDYGLSSKDARYAGRRAFGNITLAQKDVHAIWSAVWLERLAVMRNRPADRYERTRDSPQSRFSLLRWV